MPTLFSRIVAGDVPCYKIAETEDFFAFLDIRPLERGHTLCIPKLEYDYIFDLPDALFLGLHAFSREVARALRLAVPCKRVATVVIGDEVPHVHIHLVPFHSMASSLDFRSPKTFTPAEMEATAAAIGAKL